jgi:gas vesicle protein
MQSEKEEKSSSAGWYLLGGLIVGAAAGILLAPQSGVETREDLEAWRRRSAASARALFERLGDALPSRIKVAAAAGAVRGGAKEAAAEARNGLKTIG